MLSLDTVNNGYIPRFIQSILVYYLYVNPVVLTHSITGLVLVTFTLPCIAKHLVNSRTIIFAFPASISHNGTTLCVHCSIFYSYLEQCRGHKYTYIHVL